MNNRTRINRKIFTTALSALCLTATTAYATSGLWHRSTVAASTGTVDEKDINKVEFKSGRAKILNSIDDTKATIRYDMKLIHSGGGNISCDRLLLILRYKDNGEDAHVVAKLKQYNFSLDDTQTLLTFDSNDFPDLDSYQRQQAEISSSETGIFQLSSSLSYYVEVTLTKKSSAGKPEVGGIAVWAQER